LLRPIGHKNFVLKKSKSISFKSPFLVAALRVIRTEKDFPDKGSRQAQAEAGEL
jgi:hypothetical protein